jgi:ribonuclease HI
MHDAQHQHLMLADRASYEQHYEATLNFDGSARPNPGYAGWGFVLVDDYGTEIARESGFMGYQNTNNQAEWEGLIQGMESAERHGIRRLLVKGDSELVIKQMKGEMQVHNPQLKTLYNRAKAAQREFLCVGFEHVYRHYNQTADSLANAGRESYMYRYSPY